MTAPAGIRSRVLVALRARDARHSASFFGSRVANGALGLAQATLVARALSTEAAAHFFLWWTAVWLLATVFKFGLDGILPRVVAEAQPRGSMPNLRRPVAAGLVAGLVLAVPVLMLVQAPLEPGSVALAVVVAAEWAFVMVCGGYLRGVGRADVAGATTGAVWPLGAAVAAAVALASRPGAIELEVYTAVTATLATVACIAIAARFANVRPVRDLLAPRNPLPLEADVFGGAVLSGLYELMIWLPVVLAGLLHASTAMIGAVFLSTRIAGTLSWAYQGVVATISPRLARALARRDTDGAARLIRKASLTGSVLTIPPAIALVVLAEPVLRLLNPAYAPYALVLVVLAASRAVDAVTGPVGEALLVARRTWADAVLMATGIVAGGALAFAITDARAAVAAAVGASAGFVAANLLRVLFVRRLLRLGWAPA